MAHDVGLLLNSLTQKISIRILPKEALKMFKSDIGNIRFIDSLAFMNASPASLSETHVKSGESLKYTKAMLEYLDGEAVDLLLIRVCVIMIIMYIFADDNHPQSTSTQGDKVKKKKKKKKSCRVFFFIFGRLST